MACYQYVYIDMYYLYIYIIHIIYITCIICSIYILVKTNICACIYIYSMKWEHYINKGLRIKGEDTK